MTEYIRYGVFLSENQKAKLAKASMNKSATFFFIRNWLQETSTGQSKRLRNFSTRSKKIKKLLNLDKTENNETLLNPRE